MAKSINSTHSYSPQQGILKLPRDNESEEKDKGNSGIKEEPGRVTPINEQVPTSSMCSNNSTVLHLKPHMWDSNKNKYHFTEVQKEK